MTFVVEPGSEVEPGSVVAVTAVVGVSVVVSAPLVLGSMGVVVLDVAGVPELLASSVSVGTSSIGHAASATGTHAVRRRR